MFSATALVGGAVMLSPATAVAQFGQQGAKLVGSTDGLAIQFTQQGNAVALSADGNTAIIGEATDRPLRREPGHRLRWLSPTLRES